MRKTGQCDDARCAWPCFCLCVLTGSIRDDDFSERVDRLASERLGILLGQLLHQRHVTRAARILIHEEVQPILLLHIRNSSESGCTQQHVSTAVHNKRKHAEWSSVVASH